MKLRIEKYENHLKEKWDEFVLNDSVNGTFLQSRRFLSYHGNRFLDASILFYKGNDTIAAVVPACTLVEGTKKIFSSHSGSTFGGIIISRQFNNIEHVSAVLDAFEIYLQDVGYDEVILKCTESIFTTGNVEHLHYFLFQRGYTPYYEFNSFIDLMSYDADISANFTAGRRRDYRYSLNQNLTFTKVDSEEGIAAFYHILCKNLQKHNKIPVHSLEELLDFLHIRLCDIVEFYGVFFEGKLVAGSMLFNFQNRIFHTQYLAYSQEYPKLFLMNFLVANLIREAKRRKFQYFSFGISSEEKGKIFNKHLAQFKEGFGAQCGLNITYVKEYK